MKGFGLTPLFGDRRGFMPPQLKTNMIPQYFKAAVAQMTLELAHFANIFPQKKWHANKRKRSGSEKTVETLLYSKNNEN